MARKLLLTSSGLTNQRVINAFLKLLQKAPEECSVAFIPTAGNSPADQQHVQNRLAELRALGMKTIKIIDLEGMNEEDVRDQLQECDVVYVNGGNTFRLLYWAQQSGFHHLIPELISRGVIYVGVSAGSYLACPTIEAAGWKNGDANSEQLIDLSALNFVPFLVTAHYDESEALLVSESASRITIPIVALRDGQAIQVVDEQVTFIGEGEPVAFNGFAEQYLL